MAVKIKIDPLAIDIPAMLSGGSIAEQKKVAAQFARDGIQKADDINQRILGRIPPRTITVDGSRGASLESVNPDGGSIIVEYELIGGVLKWVADTLLARAPRLSGKYQRGIILLADGQEIPIDGEIPQAEEYIFIDTEPYARKIEIGKTKAGRDFVIQVPNRIFERTAIDARGRFGNQADIKFGYRELAKAYTLRTSHGRRKDRQRGSAVSSPAIIIRYRKS